MECAQSEARAGDQGFPIGRRVLELLLSELEEESDEDFWNLMRRVVAEVFDRSVFRKATSLPQEILIVASCARGVLDLGLPQGLEAQDLAQALRSFADHASPVDLELFRGEIDAIQITGRSESRDGSHGRVQVNELDESIAHSRGDGARRGDDKGHARPELEIGVLSPHVVLAAAGRAGERV